MRLTIHHLALAVGACIAGSCGVERLTAVEPIDDDAAPHGQSSMDATTDASGDDSDGPPPSDDDAVDASMCEDAAISIKITAPLDNWPNAADSGYNVLNNVYATDADPGPQTLYACSYHSWYVVSEQPGEAGVTGDAAVVESYPNVQMNFNAPGVPPNDEPAVSSFEAISSTFAEVGPQVGVYEFAYDIWLNGVGPTPGDIQILIWVDNFNRTPEGTLVATPGPPGDHTYEVWKTADNRHFDLLANPPFSSGNIDLLSIIAWVNEQNWLPSVLTLGQIDFGVEIESTGGGRRKFQIENFSLTTTMM